MTVKSSSVTPSWSSENYFRRFAWKRAVSPESRSSHSKIRSDTARVTLRGPRHVTRNLWPSLCSLLATNTKSPTSKLIARTCVRALCRAVACSRCLVLRSDTFLCISSRLDSSASALIRRLARVSWIVCTLEESAGYTVRRGLSAGRPANTVTGALSPRLGLTE